MFGKVIFPYKSLRAEAVLDDEGRWSCSALPCLERVLNISHSPVWYGQPLDPINARRCLLSAGLWLKGRVMMPVQKQELAELVESLGI